MSTLDDGTANVQPASHPTLLYGPDSPAYFPNDFIHRPRPLIFLLGLDVTIKDVHQKVLEAFTNRSVSRPNIRYEVAKVDHVYPDKKKPRLNYEGYLPAGIMPSHWLDKHLNQLPAIVVLFQDLDWDSEDYDTRQTECVSCVSFIRKSLQNHSTRLLLVLLQSKVFQITHLHGISGDREQLPGRRAAALMQACGLETNQLCYLPNSARMMTLILKLEGFFLEQAQLYYTQRIKRVRAHRDLLSKPAHAFLFVRHTFKQGIFAELKKDSHAALKYYTQAYQQISELPENVETGLEILIVGGLLNYKICQLTFITNPRPAILTFRKHIQSYLGLLADRGSIVPPELSFQMEHWLSSEYSHFAKMFTEVIDGIQILNPGMFYVIAAEYAKKRRDIAINLPASSINFTSEELNQSVDCKFYGIYPWMGGAEDDINSVKRSKGIALLQAKERLVDHTWEVINLLCRAIYQFKRYNATRMISNIKVQLAEEYFTSGDYNKILDLLLGTVALMYRKEHWWRLLTQIDKLCIASSFNELNIVFIVPLLLEACSHYSVMEPLEMSNLQTSISNILCCKAPLVPDNCPTGANLLPKWEALSNTQPQIKVDMNQIVGCIECKVAFNKTKFQVSQLVTISVHLINTAPDPIPLYEVSLHLSRGSNMLECSELLKSSDGTGVLFLEQYKIVTTTLTLRCRSSDVAKSLKTDSLHLQLANHLTGGPSRITLLWPIPSSNLGTPTVKTPVVYKKTWLRLSDSHQAAIIPRESNVILVIQAMSPSLVRDLHRMSLSLENTESVNITNICFSFELLHQSNEEKTDVYLYLDGEDSEQEIREIGNHFTFTKDELANGRNCTKHVYVRSWSPNVQEFYLVVTYDIVCQMEDGTNITCTCSKECQASLNVIAPFITTPIISNLNYMPIDSVNRGEDFLLLIDTNSSSPWPLKILNSFLILNKGIIRTDNTPSQIEGDTYEHQDIFGECFCLQAPFDTNAGSTAQNLTLALGEYAITWVREEVQNNEKPVPTETIISMPNVTINSKPFSVKTDHPAFGVQYETFPIHFTINNHTDFIQDYECGIEDNTCFVISGKKRLSFTILPLDSYTASYNFCPTGSGDLPLPLFWVKFLRDASSGGGESQLNSMITNEIYIKP